VALEWFVLDGFCKCSRSMKEIIVTDPLRVGGAKANVIVNVGEK
jgi:hypothetical protein